MDAKGKVNKIGSIKYFSQFEEENPNDYNIFSRAVEYCYKLGM